MISMKKIYRRPVLTKARQYPNEWNFSEYFRESPQGEKGDEVAAEKGRVEDVERDVHKSWSFPQAEQEGPGT